MTERTSPDLSAAGWDIQPDDGGWTITSLTADRTSVRLIREQVMDLICGTLPGTWPAFVHWTPDQTWAAIRPTESGPTLWSNRAQMDLVRALIFNHLRAALIRADDAETRRTNRHRKWSGNTVDHVNPTTCHTRASPTST